MPVEIHYRGQQIVLPSLDGNIASLKAYLEPLTDIAATAQKLIFKGKALADDDSLHAVFIGAESTVHKVLLVGATRTEVASVTAARKDDRVVNDLDKRPRRKAGPRPAATRSRKVISRYRFENITVLPGFEDGHKARELLEKLANDPGIVGLLERHQWTVGTLSELFPKGVQGMETCLMGYNRNRGQEICLRLRTDNLQGFRAYYRVREVLFHELAHMVHDEHEAPFHALNRQLAREYEELTAQGTGHALGGAETFDPSGGYEDEAEERPTGGTYTLGGDSSMTRIYTPQQMAANAAVLRLTAEEQLITDTCGSAHPHEAVEAAAASTGGEALPGTTQSGLDAAVRDGDDHHDHHDHNDHNDHDTSHAHDHGVVRAPVQEAATDVEPMQVVTENNASTSTLKEDAAMPDVTTATTTTTMEASVPEEPAGVADIVAMGFTATQAREALVRTKGDLVPALDYLLNGPPVAKPAPRPVPQADVTPMDVGDDPALAAIARAAEERVGRMRGALAGLTRQAGASRTEAAVRVLQTCLRNVALNPGDAKYRTIRLQNKTFAERVGAFPGGKEFLVAAGWREDTGRQEMVLNANADPGLLWTAISLLDEVTPSS